MADLPRGGTERDPSGVPGSPAVASTDDGDERPGDGVERGTARTNGVDTYYERRGSGPPIVFVHAAILDHSMWEPQLDALADEYTVVAYDMRGHGRTGGSDRATYSVDLFADDLAALVAALDLDRPVVCGESTGGCVAQSYAVRYPEGLSGLVLADTWSPAALDWRDRVQMASLVGTIWPVKLLGIRRVQGAATWIQERSLTPGARGDYGTIERLQAAAPPVPTEEFAKVVRAVAGFVHEDLALESVAVPTLTLYGEHTVGTVKRHVRAFAARIPDVEVREVPGGGHACNLDDHAFFSEAVRGFAARTASD